MTTAPTPQEALDEVFRSTVAKLAKDMPLLMHGSGDVNPSEVSPATAHLVAALTTHYVDRLVEGALEAHEMMRDNRVGRHDPILPPPPFHNSLQPPPALPFESTSAKEETKSGLKKRKERSTDDYWDQPLPPPKIKGQSSSETNGGKKRVNEDGTVSIDEWVGLAGVDLFRDRARAAYVQAPSALSAQSFIFPLCHDTYMYGRILELQTFKHSNLQTLLLDRAVNEAVQTEGQITHAKKQKKKSSASQGNETSGTTSDPEEDDGEASAEEDETEIPTWPGLDSLIPFYT